MALINTLRNRMGKVLVVVIGFSILAFVLADFLQNGSIGGNDQEVGEIAGETVSLKEFQAAVQERENSYMLNFNRQPTDREKPTLRQQAWDFLISKYAFEKQYDEVGTEVTDEEIWDMFQGKNINPSLKQAFTNPNTGEYDREQFMIYLQQLPNMDANTRARWEVFKNELVQGRRRLKYENLLTKTNYITNAEAEREYLAQNNVAEIEYLYIPYYAAGDSSVTISDSEAKSYYNDHQERYTVDANRSLNYVAFDIIPSADDTTFVKDELQKLRADFKTTDNDSTFASLNTDGVTFFGKYHSGNLPTQLSANISNLSEGDVRGPYLDSDGFKLYKVSKIYEDTIYNAKASHILIKGDDEEARQKAQDILNEIKNGASFEQMARENGQDGTASRGGDLGWFESGRMVDEFEDAVFGASSPGLINNLVKTEFGYHIIRVDEVKTNRMYKVATVSREVLPGDETINSAFTQADLFASNVDDLESFKAQAEEENLNVKNVARVKANDRRVGTLGEARQIVQWLFSKADEGDISEVFELDNAYVVAVMTEEVEKGTKPFETVKAEIVAKLKKDAQGEKIMEKLKGMNGTIQEMANKYGDDASVYTKSDLKLNATSLTGVGFDPKAVGRIFSLESGETSEPFMAENGVMVVNMQNKTTAPEIADYAIFKNQLQQKVDGRVAYSITEAIKDAADIEDERYKFY